MSNRAVAPVLAVLISSLASMALTTSTIAAPATDDQAEAPADECLSSPNAETPKGSHWFYRLEKGTKRKCWYLADAASKAAKTSAATTPAARSSEPDKGPKSASAQPMQPVVANARAEMTTAQPAAQPSGEDAKLDESIWPPLPERSANAVSSDSPEADNAAADTAAPSANSQNWNIAQRWPEQNAATSGASSDKTRSSGQTVSQSGTAASPPTTDKPAATVANRGIFSNTTPMLLVMLAGALIFAAVAGRMIVKYAGRKSQKARGQRRDIWGDYKPDEDAISESYETTPPWTDFDERPLRPANDPSNEIERLLSRAAKRSAA
jgi:hypothetical protein